MTGELPPQSGVFAEQQEDILRGVESAMGAALEVSGFSAREKIALGCRYLADQGHARTLAGQITVRADEPGTFWTTGFGAGFAETTVANLVRFDEEMRVLEGPGMANPAVRFHLWVYRARPELNAIVHTHPPHASALGMIGTPLRVAHMDSCVFHDDCGFLAQWPGLPLANEEGRIISKALGGKSSILLAHHGLLTAGRSLDQALYLAVLLEQACQVQLLAQTAGEIRPIPPALAAEARDFMTTPKFMAVTVDYWLRNALSRHPDAIRSGG